MNYQALKVGDVLQAGDEYHDNYWIPIPLSCANYYVREVDLRYRRPIKSETVVNYRLLNIGEVIQEGDEFYYIYISNNNNIWTRSGESGCVVDDSDSLYRRKLTGYRLLEIGETTIEGDDYLRDDSSGYEWIRVCDGARVNSQHIFRRKL